VTRSRLARLVRRGDEQVADVGAGAGSAPRAGIRHVDVEQERLAVVVASVKSLMPDSSRLAQRHGRDVGVAVT
jgi:hypothetical protein